MQEMHARDMGLIPGLGRSLGEGNGNPLQYSCLGNPTDRAACQATVQGTAESDATEHTHTHTHTCTCAHTHTHTHALGFWSPVYMLSEMSTFNGKT